MTKDPSHEIELNKQELLAEINKGNDQAINHLVKYYYPKVQWLVQRSQGFDSYNRDDIAQEVMHTLIKSIRSGKLDISKGRISSYLYAITKNKIRDYYKGKAKLNIQQLDDAVDQSSNILDNLIESERLNTLKNALYKLNEKHREVLIARYYKNLKIKDIGKKLNLSEQQVINVLRYAEKKLSHTYRDLLLEFNHE